MKYIKKFKRYIKESNAAMAEAPSETEKTPVKVPVKPTKPKQPTKPNIDQPSKDPQRKAVTAMDVVNRFIEEMHKKGESVKKYM